MLLKAIFRIVVLFNFIFVSIAEQMSLSDCLISSQHAYCNGTNGSLRFLPVNGSVTMLTLTNCYINGPLFTEDSKFQSLTELSLQDCDLSTLNVDTFEPLKALTKLNIHSDLYLAKLNLTGVRVEALNLSSCSLKEYDLPHLSTVLSQVPLLKNLTISENEFVRINTSMFSSLEHLEVLIAKSCGLETIHPYKLGLKLKEVDLSANHLKELPSIFLESSKDSLETLKLDHNPLVKITSDPMEFKSLALISLDGTNLDCSCDWGTWISSKNIRPADSTCRDPQNAEASVVRYLEGCAPEGTSGSLVVVVVVLVLVAVAAVVGCLVHRYLTIRRRSLEANKSVKYSAVYRETVESSAGPTSRSKNVGVVVA